MLAFLQEHGPYVIDDGETTFKRNDYSWNFEANVFYIESPAGVGFSVCNNGTDGCLFNDNNTAVWNKDAVLAILAKFPEINKNPLYISGESYGGIYVPKLVEQLDLYIQSAQPGDYVPNLKGFMVGNGVTDWKYDTMPAEFEMSYWYGLIDDDLYFKVKNNCDLSYFEFSTPSDECQAYLDTFDSYVANVNMYDVFGKCYKTPSAFQMYGGSSSLTQDEGLTATTTKNFFTVADYTPFSYIKRRMEQRKLKETPPCVYAGPVITYLNTDSVKQQLHITANSSAWDICSDWVGANYTKLIEGTIGLYPVFKGRYNMLKYSGDADGVVPTYGTLQWIRNLNWTITEPWNAFQV